jgi:hypothetical protein
MSWLWKIFFSALWAEIVKPLIRFLLSTVGGTVYKIAKDVVQAIELDPLIVKDEEKRRIAYEAVKTRLKSEGKVVGDSVINLAIELAVQAFKKRWP